jgi:hypothetical protein
LKLEKHKTNMFDSSINVDYNFCSFNAKNLTKNYIECAIHFKNLQFHKEKKRNMYETHYINVGCIVHISFLRSY